MLCMGVFSFTSAALVPIIRRVVNWVDLRKLWSVEVLNVQPHPFDRDMYPGLARAGLVCSAPGPESPGMVGLNSPLY